VPIWMMRKKMQRANRKKRVSTPSPLYRDFYIYVSGAYEKAYIHALHQLLREQLHINLHCSEYGGGGDFRSGIDLLKSDLKRKLKQSVTKNLDKSELIMIQGDMDVAYATKHLHKFEQELKKIDNRCKIISSTKNFEAWLKAHFVNITNQNEVVSKQDINSHISRYSDNTSNAKQYFDKSLQWKMVQKAMDDKHGNKSFREFMMIFFNDVE